MCGIFGVVVNKKSNYNSYNFKSVLEKLAVVSESRGKDSSGIAFLNNSLDTLSVIKGNLRIKKLLSSKLVSTNLNDTFNKTQFDKNNLLCFGHARLVTDGTQLKGYNNQPVIKDEIVLVHNGIIVNNQELWNKNPQLKREFEIDTEIINSLLDFNISNEEFINDAIELTFKNLLGNFSIAGYFAKLNSLLLASNNGSLHYVTDQKNFLFFASEKNYFEKLGLISEFKKITAGLEITQLSVNDKIWIDLNDFSIKNLKNEHVKVNFNSNKFKLKEYLLEDSSDKKELVIDPSIYINKNEDNNLYSNLEFNIDRIKKLKRCSKCILPETFPHINFDNDGVCNYCKNYRKKEFPKNLDYLKEIVEPYRKTNGQQDCIVPFSGGRDSTYALHIIKNELKLNPITITYDWGMVTDLARRNISRVCGKLGVENILISADIKWKRQNIKKNIEAWLKYPNLGMIPLFMAGDKFFFYYTDRLKKQTGIKLNIWGINDLENTDFKIGFAGIEPQLDKERIYSISALNKAKLFYYVGKNVLKSPGLINQSILDSIGSFAVRYFIPKKDYYHLFDFYKWDEDEINYILNKDYSWEKAIDTDSTWRIGDGTASFYNYIYYTVAGFTEFDTFRSNQIREGMIERQRALDLVNIENSPRYETIRWYLEIIGIDFFTAIDRINKIPKLYDQNSLQLIV